MNENASKPGLTAALIVGVPRGGVDPVGENPTLVIDCSPGRTTDSHTREGVAEALLFQIVNP